MWWESKNKSECVIHSTVLIKRITSHVRVCTYRMYSVWDHHLVNVCEWVSGRERERCSVSYAVGEEWLNLNHWMCVIVRMWALIVLCVIMCYESIAERLKEFCDRMTFERIWKEINSHPDCPIPPFLISSLTFLHTLSPQLTHLLVRD